MKREFLKITVGLFVLSFMALSVSAQFDYSVSFSGGVSNLHELNKAYVYDDHGFVVGGRQINYGNYYNYSSVFSVEASVIERIKKSNISFEQGIAIESRSFYNNVGCEIDPSDNLPSRWKETYYSCNIPLKIKCELIDNFSVLIGVNNILNIGTDAFDSEIFETNFYQVRGVVGFDVVLFDNLILGSEYSYDISPYSKMIDYDLTNRFDILTLKIGYLF